jgi:hypothetical protein
VPADRPRTAAQARAVAATADDDDGLAAAWEAERPPARWRDRLGPEASPCPQCGQPTRWTGAHTALVCLGHDRPLWSVSPGAKTRAAEHLAAIDKSAARRSAQLADPAAERAAAEALASDRAELLDDLDGLAELLDVDDFPRAEPYTAARRAGVRYGAVVEMHKSRARKTETLDQLGRVRGEVEHFAAGIGGWLDRIDELRDTLDQANDGDDYPDAIDGEVIDGADRRRSLPSGNGLGTYCAWCSTAGRRAYGRYPEAVARIEAPGMAPAPVDVCGDHLADAKQRYGAALHVHDQFWAAYDIAAQAAARTQSIAAAIRKAAEARQ